MGDAIKSIVLVPIGGLCNRLRATFSAMALARDCRVPLRVVWLRDKGLNARFSDLFEPLPDIAVTVVDSRSWMRYGVARRRNLYLPALWQRYAFDSFLTESVLTPLCNNLAQEELSGQIRDLLSGNVLIQTGLGFYPADDKQLMQRLVPSRQVRSLMEDRQKRITPHTVGLHIRRTDNGEAIKHSPTEAFEAAMRKDLQQDAQTEFYIATDEPAVAAALARRFPTCVWQEEKATRATVEGMQEAVAELLTLIACPRFHGSYWSSFSDMIVACHQEGQADIIDVEQKNHQAFNQKST